MPKEVRRGEVEYGGRGGFDKIARTEMARIKAGMTGEKEPELSPFEKRAQELIKRQEEAKRWRKPWSGGGPRDDDGMPLVSFHELPLKPKPGQEEDDETLMWKQVPMHPDGERPKRLKMNGAMISYLALNLRTREWAKAMGTLKSGRKKMEETFEREAERWAARKLVSAAKANPPKGA